MPVTMNPVTSSNVKAVGYDPSARALHVEFKGAGTYVYADVPPRVHQDVMQARSIGSHVPQHITGKFKHTKGG